MRTRTVPIALSAASAVAALAIAFSGCSSGQAGATNGPAGQATKATGAKPAALVAAGSPAASGGTATSQPTITTTGTGNVNGAPDTMTVSIDVSTHAPHVGDALAQNNTVAAKVQQVLKTDGVAAADLQTSGLSLQPTSPPAAAGYQVDDTVTATLRNLANAGTVIDDALVAAGDAGRLGGVNLSISDTNPLMVTARQQAVTSARTDAQQLASAAGDHLGALISLTDQPGNSYGYGSAGFGGGASGTPSLVPVPVQGGTQQLSVTVTAVWAIST